jgi:hypothetical protein
VYSKSIFFICIDVFFRNGMARATVEVEDWAAEKSFRNMLRFYRKALVGLKNGECIVDSVPFGIRKMLAEYGVIRRFGNKFELTKLGAELI